jgi:serine protease AprX
MNKIDKNRKKNLKWIFTLLFWFLFEILSTQLSYSQLKTFRVFFIDKGPEKFDKGSALYKKTYESLAPKALSRRSKVLSFDNIISISDAPVYEKYINAVLDLGAKKIHSLKWRNYIVVECDSLISNDIRDLPFVINVNPTSSKLQIQTINSPRSIQKKFDLSQIFIENTIDNCGLFLYGDSFFQNSLMSSDLLHNIGITGDSIIIGVLDNGFKWRNHNATKFSNVIAEFDFVQLDSVTSNQGDDPSNQDGHGTLVFSTIAGYYPGKLIGTASNAKFYLAKTESMKGETRIEEDNYAAAMEWLESLGVDITTSSLAYNNFDSSEEPYHYDQDFNGSSSISASAINEAVKRGVVCLNAAGNSGPSPKTLNTPADADSAITVGALVLSNNSITPTNFSSRGPTATGEIKPDLSALGYKVVCVNPDSSDGFISANGTSLATPLLAGAIAQILSAFPEKKPWEVRKLLYSYASVYPEKDNNIGFGYPDIMKSMKNAGTVIAPPSSYPIDEFQRVVFYIIPDSKLAQEPFLYFKFNSTEVNFKLYKTKFDYQYACDIPISFFINDTALCRLSVSTIQSLREYPYNKDDYFFLIKNMIHYSCGVNPLDFTKFDTDANLIIYPNLIDRNTTTINLSFLLTTSSDAFIRIYNSIGEEVNRQNIYIREAGIGNTEIDVMMLPSGMYYVYLILNNQKSISSFLILR